MSVFVKDMQRVCLKSMGEAFQTNYSILRPLVEGRSGKYLAFVKTAKSVSSLVAWYVPSTHSAQK